MLKLDELQPAELHFERVTSPIFVADALGGPAADGIDNVGWALRSAEPITKAVSERVNHAPFR